MKTLTLSPGTAALLAAFLLTGCAGLSIDRTTQTSGTFVSSGLAFTIASIDLPKPAIDIARENASDSNLANLEVESAWVFPNLGPLDWLLEIIGVRYARIEGTWGFPGE
ncbi:MAG: hypothetical protein QF724_06555 [Planctomycetota bacterium]|jgi:hypothetical protein|nr:hypothetical protein [Planctomycetota bacterium]MDP6518321.1 hypothetical protein [Planctomycetota bacterium]MDP6838581.1 hypothetical protein [Planctomycetota bacterium]MDP6957131.1 hypothetical protein [Planctomycetota bacterium]